MADDTSPAQSLRARSLKPRKRLGQNFLRDRRYLPRILSAAGLPAAVEVLEIGAGTGVLTAALAGAARRVVAVELDDALYDLLGQDLADKQNVEIVHANALDVDPCDHFAGPYRLIANIPYYITGPILRRFLEANCRPELMVLMVQREVARRMTAPPGELSLLGVSVQYYAEVEIITRVPAGAFYPPPKVDSAIVRLRPHESRPEPEARDIFFRVARAGFGTRRKQLANALALGLGINRAEAVALLSSAGIEPSRRAETLDIGEWKRLAAVYRANAAGGSA